MELTLLDKLSGTLANAATVALGTGLGLVLRGRLPERMARIMVQGVGLTTLFIGLSMAQALGEAKGLEGLGERIKRAVPGGGSFTEGFVPASLLFCVGPMTLLGAIQNGLVGDPSLLLLKATLDGLSAIALTSSFGVGVGFSVLVTLLYQGGVALLAGTLSQALPDPAQDPRVLLVTGVGGLMILGIGINLLGLTRVRVASFLPALLLAPLVWALADRLG